MVGETENLEAPSTPPRQKTPEPQEAVSPAKVDRVNSDSNMRVRHVFKDGYWVQEPYKTAAQGQPVGQSAACSPIPSGTSQIPFFSSYSNDNSLLGSLSCTDVLNGLEHGSFKDRSPFSVGKPHASPLGKQEMYQPSPLSLNESKSKIPKPATAPCPTRTNHQQDLYASTDLALCCTQQEQNLVEDFVDLRDASSIAWADVHKTLSSSLSAKRVGDLRRSIKSGTKSPPGEKAGPFFTGSGLAIRGLFGEDRGSAQNESSFEKSIGMQCQSAERTSNHGTSSSYGGSSFRSSIDKENIQDLGQSSTNFGSSHSFALSEWAKNCATRYPDDALRMSEEDWKGVKRMECEEDLQAERHVLYQTIPEACNVEDAQSDVHTSGVSMETPCETKAGKRELLLGGATCILLLLSLGCYVLTRWAQWHLRMELEHTSFEHKVHNSPKSPYKCRKL